ncbi:MAG: PorT family protein [Lewinellaceae bacterium]|nr:PorT family protein [Saprospiraceae bacterium]MCB9343000.1 PorT family protein [Lewinellaceae bacterium]
MKQIILLPLLVITICFQSMHAQSLNFGVKAGGQLIHMTHINDSKDAILYHGGAFLEIPVADRLSIQAELLCSAQGVNDSESDDFKQRNFYLQLPVMAKFQVWKGLSVHAGAQAGWLMSAHLKVDDGESKDSYENKDDFKEFDYGVLAGAEYLITKNLGIGARVNWGLSEVFEASDKPRQHTFQAYVSYRFKGAKF